MNQRPPIQNRDNSEEIASITWTVYGKIKAVTRTGASTKPDLEYIYDASGNRLVKVVKPKPLSCATYKYYYYLRDASGNEMAHYELTQNAGCSTISKLYVTEHAIYGSSRLGIDKRKRLLYNNGTNLSTDSTTTTYRGLGEKLYELSNHLGNVLATVSDKHQFKTNGGGSPQVDWFEPEITTINDYYAYGAPMPTRTWKYVVTTPSVTTLTNCDFNTGSTCSWSPQGGGSSATLVSNKLQITNSVRKNIASIVSGTTYTFSFDISGLNTGAGHYIRLNLTQAGTPLGTTQWYYANGTASYTYTSIVSGTIQITLDCWTPSFTPATCSIDDFKVTYPSGLPPTVLREESYRYGFNGMLKDDEIADEGSDYDFGARIYDSRLGRWFSLDPLMTKYPNLSPYNGMGNSPIFYVDYNGKDIIHRISDATATTFTTLYYKDGKWFNRNGNMEYDITNDKYLTKLTESLTILASTPTGKSLISSFGEGQDVEINNQGVTKSNPGSYVDGMVAWDPFRSSTDLVTEKGSQKAPAWLVLGHELAHAQNDLVNKARNTKTWYVTLDGQVVKNDEKYASHIENKIRSEHGLSLRTHYSETSKPGDPAQGEGSDVTVYEGELVDLNGKSVFYTDSTGNPYDYRSENPKTKP